MKASRILVSLLVMFAAVWMAAPASAQNDSKNDSNFVKGFLARYKPAPVQATASTPADAQVMSELIRNGQLPLTMGDFVNLILQNNLDVNVNRLTPVSSQYLINTFYKQFEPSIHLQATVNRSNNPATTTLAGARIQTALQGQYTVGFQQNLTTGTLVGVDVLMNRNSSNSLFSTINPNWAGSLRYSLTQHLLRDFGRKTNTHLIRAAKNSEKMSEVQFEKQMMDLVAQGQRSYWDLVFSAEDIKVKQRSMDLAQKTLSDNQIQVQIGTLAPIDLVQAESEVANRRVQYVTSTYTEVLTQDQVKKLITTQGDPGTILAKLTPMQGVRKPDPSDVPSVEDAIKIALENRPELKQLQVDLENKNIDYEYTKNQLLPSFDMIGSYTQSGTAGTLAPIQCDPLVRACTPPNPDVIGGLGTAFGQIFGYNYGGYSVGFNLTIPLRNRAAQGDNARAATDKRIAESRITAQAQQIALEVRNALTQVDMNRAKIEAAQKARELAEQRLSAEQKKFDLGASTIRFVLEEQRNVAQAQTDELQSLVNYTKSLVDVDRATGMTLKKNNIEIEKALNPGTTAK
jgi:outer membrane protein TolC